MRPSATSYPSYFNNYIKLIGEDDLLPALAGQTREADRFFRIISESQSTYKYDDEKWTIKEILQHVIDTERIFCFRALSIARGDQQTLPSFDENRYAAHSHANDRSWNELTEEFIALRQATNHLFRSFNFFDMESVGRINDYEMSVLALGFTIAGHAAHHINIIKERYLDID